MKGASAEFPIAMDESEATSFGTYCNSTCIFVIRFPAKHRDAKPCDTCDYEKDFSLEYFGL